VRFSTEATSVDSEPRTVVVVEDDDEVVEGTNDEPWVVVVVVSATGPPSDPDPESDPEVDVVVELAIVVGNTVMDVPRPSSSCSCDPPSDVEGPLSAANVGGVAVTVTSLGSESTLPPAPKLGEAVVERS
jgi:hypothetical protein